MVLLGIFTDRRIPGLLNVAAGLGHDAGPGGEGTTTTDGAVRHDAKQTSPASVRVRFMPSHTWESPH